ncbi:MmcQ/YjbR family DNA-binding protein [Limosilactobacillus equigenerosi]|uniref:MmcQ/YjbR family DNA-binding protein n=1 Tax=Limosilactobacillus equigenerosi TaxID=417373 RepID=UPI001CDA86FE|nr:MmcQ/YjbR family DNA-binding protein [Limosilactobacillus equigenerosi]
MILIKFNQNSYLKKHPDYVIFRHQRNRKWFALVMEVAGDKLGRPSHELKLIVNVKIDPTEIEILTQGVGFYPAYHMNKQHWVSIDLAVVESTTVLDLIAQSFSLTNV